MEVHSEIRSLATLEGGGESTIETCEKVLWEFHRESSVRLINSERFV